MGNPSFRGHQLQILQHHYEPNKRPKVNGPTPGVKNPTDGILPGFGDNVKSKGMPIGSINVEGLRRMLIAHGYHIPASGNGMGKLMKAALADFINPSKFSTGGPLAHALAGTHITGTRDPAAFNKRFGIAGKDRSVVTLGPGKTLDSKGNSRPGNAEQAGPAGNGGTVNLSGLSRIASAAGTPIPTSLAGRLAQAGAGEQYDPQIHDVQDLLAQSPVDAAQHSKNISDWYGQVLNALNTASGRDSAATKAGIGSMQGAVASILSSLGGSANQGAGDVGAMGANDVGTLQAIGASQDMLNNDLAPIMQSEKASQLSSQANKDTNAQTALQQQLEDLQGQRGQAVASQKANLLMQILDSNNKTAEQNFQDRLATQQAGEAAQLNGLKALYYGSKANTPQRGSFGYATPTEINNVQNAILSHILDPNGNLKPGLTMAKATQLARTVGGTYFPAGGMPNGWAQSVVAPYFGG